ncbi:hypothetical protein Bca52824_022264 [Brassica carinata]|uniref:F-box family protein n=1 Tax=Brassica carinata TaxID=52824 RepID=A0A8X8AU83_BRACI|nr:hypothetical protein Bca52824_022264 [Brassica carinata]
MSTVHNNTIHSLVLELFKSRDAWRSEGESLQRALYCPPEDNEHRRPSTKTLSSEPMAVSPALVSGLRILSELPTAEDVVATMVLSKHWLPLWKSVPKLVFDDDGYEDIDTGRFSRFVDRCLILHKAPIETLHFELTQSSTVADIGIWIDMAVQRCVRDLSIDIDCASSTNPVVLPRSLYAEAVECL